MEKLNIYTVENIIKVVGLITREPYDLHAFQEITKIKTTRENFRNECLKFIYNGYRNQPGVGLLPMSGITNKLDFVMSKPVNFFDSCPTFKNLTPSMSSYCSKKINQCFQCLNDNQKRLFLTIHRKLTDSIDEDLNVVNPFFMMINSRSGTGKSTLIGVLASSMITRLYMMVYSNNLKEFIQRIHPNINAYTNCKFIMSTMRYNYKRAITSFNPSSDKPLCYIFKTLLKQVKQFELTLDQNEDLPPHLLVFDEVTLLSPFFIIFMKFVSIYKKINIIMVGDSNQQKAIKMTKYHKMNNMALLKSIVDGGDSHKLDIQMRIEDEEFKQRVGKIEEILDMHKDNIKMNFHYKYLLYELFREKFTPNEDFKNLYFSSTHNDCKIRCLRHFKYAKENGVKYHVIPYKNMFNKNVKLPNYKFMPCLILIEGFPYIKFTFETKNKEIVTFVDYKDDKVVVRTSNNTIEELNRITLNDKNTIDDAYEWLKSNDARKQFPLRPYVCTYYSSQGLTMKTSNIEVNIDETTLNAVYVGITRVKRMIQLRKIHTCDYNGLIFSMLKNDGNYYKIDQNEPLNLEKFKTLKFELVPVRFFDSIKNRNVYVSRAHFIEFINKSYDHNSDLLKCYDSIKNDNIHSLMQLSMGEMHKVINCPCDGTFNESDFEERGGDGNSEDDHRIKDADCSSGVKRKTPTKCDSSSLMKKIKSSVEK